MLRFEEQQQFEAWLRRCPLPSKALAYAVSRTGDNSLLTIECRWRLPGYDDVNDDKPPDTEVISRPATQLTAEPPTVQGGGSICGEGAGSAEGDGGGGSSSVCAGAGAAPSMDEGDAAQIASLQGGLGAMKTMLASGGMSADALAAMVGPDGAGGLATMTNPGGGGGGGSGGGGRGGGDGSGGGAALAAMLLQQRAAMGDGLGAPPRTDPGSVRAVLELCQGFSCPKPPGAT